MTALQNELAALGYGGSRSGVFDWATWDAWRRLYAANAGTATAAARVQQGAFSRALAVWLPAQTMSVSCAASLGSTVTGDSTDSLACVLSSCYRPVWREFSFRKSGRF